MKDDPARDVMQNLGRAIKAVLPPEHGFILLVTPYGDGDGRCNYVASITRQTAIHAMKEFLLKCGAAEDWMKDIV